jgi:glucosamine kinase
VAIYLGIDGGGTKTTCAVADEKFVLATGTSGGSNITRYGDARVREALHAVVRDACAAAKISASQIASACVGLSGAGRPEVRDAVARMIAEVLPGKVLVVSDLETTLEAAFGGGPGIIVIAGTGSIAYGRDANGLTARAGGWGLAISDEGSGQWIGRAAVSAVLGAKDAGEDPPLLEAILKLWSLSSLDELVRYANASPPPDFSSLVPVVVAAAENPRPSGAWTGHPDGTGILIEAGRVYDPVAANVLRQAGHELARLAANVIHRLFAKADSVPVATSGGVFREAEEVRRVFYNEVTSEFPQARLHSEVVDPLHGALALARKALARQLR